MQELMNSMTDSGEFQDVEPNHCGRLSHVSTQTEMISSSRSVLSRDKRLPLDTWNQSGVQENVFGNPFFYVWFTSRFSSKNSIWRRAKESSSSSWRSKGKNKSDKWRLTKIMAQVQCRCLRPDRWLWVLKIRLIFRRTTWVGQQRQQLSELQFDRFSNPSSFLVWKTKFKTQVSSVSDFPSEAMLLSKEVEMVDSSDGLKILTISIWKSFSTFWDARREVCLGSGQDHQEFPVQQEGQPRGAKSPKRGPLSARKTNRLHDLRLLSSDWCSWRSIGLCSFILCYSSWWQHSGIRHEMGRSFIIGVSDDFIWPTSDFYRTLVSSCRHQAPASMREGCLARY